MNEKIVTVDSAALGDVRPGDYIIWEWVRDSRGSVITEKREGIAHHLGYDGRWETADGAWLAAGDGEGVTITIHRTDKEGQA